VAGRYVLPEVLDDLSDVVTDSFLVSEESIRDGMRLIYRCSGLIVEPAAALASRRSWRSRAVPRHDRGDNSMWRKHSTSDFEKWVVQGDR